MPGGSTFKALVLDEVDGRVSASIKTLDDDALPDGDVTIAVSHSSLNYKDGMILGGIGRLVRSYPHIPGIDLVGTVTRSESPAYRVGDAVVLTGWRVGEHHWGGYAQRARLAAAWLVPLPDGLSPVDAMALGTAGLTAMLAVVALEDAGLTGAAGEVVVTGASGGLGGIAIALLAGLGYTVVAATGRMGEADRLRDLGARTVIERAELAEAPDRPLLSERWAGAIDTVGGKILASVIAATRYRGAVAACGNAGGNTLPTTVLPFILRGVRLIGIDSAMCPLASRRQAWARLARDMPKRQLESLTSVIGLADLPAFGRKIIDGETRGRIVVDTQR